MSQSEREVWFCLIAALAGAMCSLTAVIRCWRKRMLPPTLGAAIGAFSLPSLILAAASVCWLAGDEGLKEDGGEFLLILFPGGLLVLSGSGAVLGWLLSSLAHRYTNRSGG